jgi:hypothetical protein
LLWRDFLLTSAGPPAKTHDSNRRNRLFFLKGRRVLECLQKCLKVSNAAIEFSYKFVGLFVELLDSFVYFFGQKLEDITAQFVGQLMTLCSGHLSYAKQQGNLEPVVSKHFVNLVNFVERRKALQTDDLAKDGRWSQVILEDDVKAWP